VVVGRAPRAGPPPLWQRPAAARAPAVIAADGATTVCLNAGLVPDVIVTDLDGPVASEVAANVRGALVAVHAHGDNAPAIDRWVPEFTGQLAGSWAGPPRDGLFDVGGFTDGTGPPSWPSTSGPDDSCSGGSISRMSRRRIRSCARASSRSFAGPPSSWARSRATVDARSNVGRRTAPSGRFRKARAARRPSRRPGPRSRRSARTEG